MGVAASGFNAKDIHGTFIESARLFALAAEDTSLHEAACEAAEMIIACLKNGGKLLLCGNGGSAADAQHFAGEMVGSFLIKNRAGLAAVALNADTSVLTCVGNDRSYDEVFAQQVGALGRAGDVLLGFSTSGNSKNVVRAFEPARSLDMKLIALTGSGGILPQMADTAVCVPSVSTPRIQEVHALLIHIICGYVEAEMFKNEE